MYGDKKCDNVDQLRAKLFCQKFENGKTVGLSLLHPCAKNLHLHMECANYVVNICRELKRLTMLLDLPTKHGWDSEGNINGEQKCFPK